MKIKLLSATATMPRRATYGASCHDIFADLAPPQQVDGYEGATVTLPSMGQVQIATGWACEVPRGMEVQIRPRSGLAAKHGILAAFGTVDSDYRGEVKVTLFNHGPHSYTIRHGERIAQFAVGIISMCDLELTSELSPTERGNGGFGSTGK